MEKQQQPPEQMCACGRPLHYERDDTRTIVQRLVDEKGEFVDVVVGEAKYKVPRHYIALHGLKAVELPELANQLGFEQVGR